jgi:hypothetical protein
METYTHLIHHQSKHSLNKVKPGRFIKVCFLFIFTISLFCPPFQMAALAGTSPSLLAPANGVTITATGAGVNAWPPVALPDFSWSAVDGATSYRIQISSDTGFSNIKYENTTPLTHLIPTNLNPFNDGLWYWRVRVDSPTAGFYSSANSFTKQWASSDNLPVLVSPPDGATLEFYDAPTFSWQPVVGAAGYKFQIATSSDFSFSTLVYDQSVVATTHQPLVKLANGTYYWRVVPVDPIGREGTPSAVRSFIMGYNLIPQQLEPTNHSHPTFTPTFHWTAVRGANSYRLDYSTNSDLSGAKTVNTPNTTYTPGTTLPNDVNYYWRVRSISGNSQSDWSSTWDFLKQWYICPLLLTPTNNFTHVRLPFFSWAPVPGANYYRIELSLSTDFANPLIKDTTSNTFYTPANFNSSWNLIYWRVIPFDAEGYRGKESSVFSFRSDAEQITPELIYPFYYYLPNSFPSPFNKVTMNPAADRTATWPIFMWGRLTDLNDGNTVASAYRLQVSTSSSFYDIVWSVDTQNTTAAPTITNNFEPVSGQDYFWRVRGLDSSGTELGNWSQTWQTRFSLAPASIPTQTPPQLLRPMDGAEIVETTPLLEWLPVSGADSYEVQISDDPFSFATPLDSGMAPYPAYSPVTSLAQRSLGMIKYGTFYWRVRARSGGNPLGDWGETRRFQIASQSQRIEQRTLGNPINRFLIASDPVDTSDKKYELTNLYATQSADNWYFGFNTTLTATNVTYALYLDLDHQEEYTGTVFLDPRGYTASTIAAHRPEFVIYVDKAGSSFSASTTMLYGWNGVAWDSPQLFSDINGEIFYDPTTGYVEIQVPNTAIKMADNTWSLSLSLFSAPLSGGQAVDSVPSNPNIPGSGLISRFTSVSERVNIIFPPSTDVNDPNTYTSMPPFSADYPTGSDGTVPWTGARLEVYLDSSFTTQIGSYNITSNTPYYAPISHSWPDDFTGDNTYYWRVQPCYTIHWVCGAWNQSGKLVRVGFVPQHLQESVSFATPTFSWDLVEGARRYQLQVTQNNFAAPLIDVQTDLTSYTYPNTLPNGTYYWRVKTIRYGSYEPKSEWSDIKTFTLTLPVPTNLSPNNPDPVQAIHTMPTFCWQPVIASANDVPVLTAYRYIVQVSLSDSSFSSLYEQVNTEQSCWTPSKGYDDGTYYWRVAMVDGNNRIGDFSDPAVFTKQYPAAKPLSPVNGSTVSGTPTFSWTAVDGVTPYVFGAAKYRLQISQVPTFSPIYEQVDTYNTRYTPTRLYDIGKTYYWRVAIIDRDGKIGPFNNATVIIDPFPFHAYLPAIKN